MLDKAPVEKSSIYFALLGACGKHGCPVCRLMEEASTRYLDTLLYEQVTDVGVRQKLRRARGLCNWHSWQVRQITTAALGAAIIAKDLLEEECAALAELQRPAILRRVGRLFSGQLSAQSLRAYLRGWLQRELCPACQVVVAYERHALETLLNGVQEEDFARPFAASAGLCVPHMVRAAELGPSHPSLSVLVELQRGKYMQVVAELEEFCRKHDYRFARETWGLESDSWLRAIELIAGRPKVFGSDVQRRHAKQSSLQWWIRLIDRYLRGMARALFSTKPDHG